MKVKLKLEPHQMKAKLYFAQQHMSCTTGVDTIIWLDGRNNNLDDSDGLIYYFRNFTETVMEDP